MRKIIVLLLGVLLLVLPVSAQTDSTIVDYVSAEDNYSLLADAVQAADPVVLETLSGAGPLTLLAPTNQAFRNLASEFDADVNTLLADTDLITGLLLYHVVNGQLSSADVIALDGELVNPLLPNSAFEVTVESGVIRLNGIVRVVQPFDVTVSNGVIHTVSDMIFPISLQSDLEALSGAPAATPQPTAAPTEAPAVEATAEPAPDGDTITPSSSDGITVTGTEDIPDALETEVVTVATFPSGLTIAGRVASDPRYSTLYTVLTEVAPDYIDLLNGEDELTLLAPSNTAFINLLSTLDIDLETALEQPVLLRQILAYHVVEGAVFADDLTNLEEDDNRVDTILDNGQFRESFRVEINDRGRVIFNGVARVTSPDLAATNGVLHTIDEVILPQVALDTLEDLGLIEEGALEDS